MSRGEKKKTQTNEKPHCIIDSDAPGICFTNSPTDVSYLSGPRTFQINRPQLFINLSIFLLKKAIKLCQ